VARFLIVWVVLMAFCGLVRYAWDAAVVKMGIQTWTMFLQAKAEKVASGLDLTVPSRAIAVSMTEASAFEAFMTCILSGIFGFAAAGTFLRAAKGVREHWFRLAFGGFKCPLDVAWLYFRLMLQITLWSLLFVLPGVMAYYRYCQAWNLKVENPDWSAGKCLAESARLMDGHKARRFALDMSYWRPITWLLLGLLTMVVCRVFQPVLGALGGAIAFALSIACMWGTAVLAVYMSIGQALFYLGLTDGPARSESDRDT